MKNFLLAIFVVFITVHAYAATDKVVSVEFQLCSDNPINICALVYQETAANGAFINFHGEEMAIEAASDGIAAQIRSTLTRSGRSLAMNVQGQVFKVSGKHGWETYLKLKVTSFNVRGDVDVPRGL